MSGVPPTRFALTEAEHVALVMASGPGFTVSTSFGGGGVWLLYSADNRWALLALSVMRHLPLSEPLQAEYDGLPEHVRDEVAAFLAV